jgi:hypothetical protein
MVSDRLYDYEFALRNTEKLLNQDPKVREADRKLIQAFMRHIKAQGVSVGRLAKYLNHLRRCAQLIPVPFSRAKRGDIEELLTRLTDFEWFVKRKDGTIARRTRYSAETMADFRMAIKRFMKFVRFGDTDKETPFPDEVRWIRTTVKLSDKKEPEFFDDADASAMSLSLMTVIALIPGLIFFALRMARRLSPSSSNVAIIAVALDAPAAFRVSNDLAIGEASAGDVALMEGRQLALVAYDHDVREPHLLQLLDHVYP